MNGWITVTFKEPPREISVHGTLETVVFIKEMPSDARRRKFLPIFCEWEMKQFFFTDFKVKQFFSDQLKDKQFFSSVFRDKQFFSEISSPLPQISNGPSLRLEITRPSWKPGYINRTQ